MEEDKQQEMRARLGGMEWWRKYACIDAEWADDEGAMSMSGRITDEETV